MEKKLVILMIVAAIVLIIISSINYEGIKQLRDNLQVWVRDHEKIKTEPRPFPEDAVDRLNISGEVEITEYMGQKLTPIAEQRKFSSIDVDKEEYMLQIYGLVNRSINLSYEEITQDMPKISKSADIYFPDNYFFTAKFTGIPFFEILSKAKEESNDAEYATFYSADGAITQLTLNYLIGEEIILAYRNNDITLKPEQGFPLILVAEDKLSYKWARWITKIEITDKLIEGEDENNWGDIRIAAE
jgi:DMSO/TMAO reductase YedYZ molybdopterin-dependent catalytic subunit